MLTKTQTIAHLAEKAQLPKKQVAAILDELAALAVKHTKAGGQFVIPGLGKAVKVARKARMGRNPQTGEAIKIPARKKVGFTVAKSFKQSVLGAKK